jgi:hypothetical protein
MSVREKILGAEARWVMGRVMAGDFLDGVDKYLHLGCSRAREGAERRDPGPGREPG